MLVDATYPLDELVLRGARSEGDRRPLLFLHGVTRRWQTFLTMIPSLAPRWQINAIDARGHGGSDRSATGYRVADYVPDAISVVRDRIARPTVIYGHSLGAMVAAALAAELPELVRAVVLEDPPFDTMGDRIGETSWLSFFRGLHPFAGDRRPIADVTRDLAEIRIAAPGGESVRLGDLRSATQMRFTTASVKRLDRAALDPIVEGRWLDGYDRDGIIGGIRCPVLLLQADDSAGGMLSDSDADFAESTISDLVRIRFPGAGHVLHWERTEELVRHVTAFLESLDD